ncbi:transposase [Variovorax sp. J22R133]|uniref:transposase n=1 Tax=Variovorax brevis TaxID=3053503 RepID=UPI002578B204|nr:transposase [Variovorax sp. J22R133]MDM0116726.1 transposase [Variovorax sp. J22R133]
MTRLKNRIQSILHVNLIARETGRIYSKKGRARLEELPLPPDQQRVALRHHDELDRLAVELAVIDKELAQRALDDPNVKQLMTIGGVNSIVAASAIGDIKRFSSPEKLVSYFGLNPSVH